MKKIIFLIILLIPFNILALNYPEISSPNIIVYDLTDDNILYEKNSEEEKSIASLTKILTTITAIENIDNLDDTITYTSNMASLVSSDASIAGLTIGTTYSYRDLLYASMLPSGADATTALAISISGSIEDYVAKMNDIAHKIGMNNSEFVNVTGLDAKGHYSTIKDILKLLKYSLQNEQFKEIYTTKTYTLSNGLLLKSTVFAYKGDTERILGSKTGFTLNAGRCISVYFKSNGHDLIIITLGANSASKTAHITDALELITFIDSNYHYQDIIKSNDVIKSLPVKNSKIDSYDIIESKNITKYLPDDYDKSLLKIEYKGLEQLSFKNKKNTKIGEVKYYYDNDLLESKDIYLETKIKLDIIKLLISYKYIVLSLLLIILFTLAILFRKRIKLNKSKI